MVLRCAAGLEYIIKNGIDSEEDYPYKGEEGKSCKGSKERRWEQQH
jgi:Papain family cysteine protease